MWYRNLIAYVSVIAHDNIILHVQYKFRVSSCNRLVSKFNSVELVVCLWLLDCTFLLLGELYRLLHLLGFCSRPHLVSFGCMGPFCTLALLASLLFSYQRTR